MAKILVLHGPNLNMLGRREPGIYGQMDLESINQVLLQQAENQGHTLVCWQSNAEHELLEIIQQSDCDFLLFNPAAFTHTSVALRDALLAAGLPFIEVHLSNPHSREPFRQQSYFSDVAKGVVCGFGAQSYQLALQAVDQFIQS